MSKKKYFQEKKKNQIIPKMNIIKPKLKKILSWTHQINRKINNQNKQSNLKEKMNLIQILT